MSKKKKIIIFAVCLVIICLIGLIYFYFKHKGNDKFTNNNISNNIINSIDNYTISNNVNTNSSHNENNNKVFSIKNKDFYLFENNNRDEEYKGFKLLEYNNSNDKYAEIYYILYDYTTDPSFNYSLKITDELNNNLLSDGNEEQVVIGGVISTAKIKKIGLDKKINIDVFEKYSETKAISKSAKKQIDLSQDLEERIKIDQSSNLSSAILGNVKFEYIDYKDVYHGTTQHAYSTKLVGETYSIPVKMQYGNRLIQGEHITFSLDRNVNNLTLEEVFENLKLINENFGQYGLSDVYGLTIVDKEGKVTNEIVVSFDEMIKLCKGQTIEKDGKKYSKDSFDRYSLMPMEKEKDVTIGKGIKAIKYYFPTDEDYEHYMFVHKDNIYYVTFSKNKRASEVFEQFLNSLSIIN